MTQAEHVNDILKRKPYRSLNSPRLKPTPDLTWPLPLTTINQDELDEAKLILDYEQTLQAQIYQRGY